MNTQDEVREAFEAWVSASGRAHMLKRTQEGWYEDLTVTAWWAGWEAASVRKSKPSGFLTTERIEQLWAEHGLDDCDPEGFARLIEREVLAKRNGQSPFGWADPNDLTNDAFRWIKTERHTVPVYLHQQQSPDTAEIMKLADHYAHVYSFVGDSTMPRARAALEGALNVRGADEWLKREAAIYRGDGESPNYHTGGLVDGGDYLVNGGK